MFTIYIYVVNKLDEGPEKPAIIYIYIYIYIVNKLDEGPEKPAIIYIYIYIYIYIVNK